MPDDQNSIPEVSRAQTLYQTGVELHMKQEFEPARLHYLAALISDPGHVLALQNLGALFISLGKFHMAEVISRRALAIDPSNPHIQSNLANALTRLRRYNEAEVYLDDAAKSPLRHEVNSAGIWHNRGLVKFILGDFDRALACFDKALELQPGTINVLADKGLCLLALGQIQKGLTAYEVRWESLYRCQVWDLGIPEWQGEDLKGRSLLVHHEQGFGDGLMLCRFLSNLRDLGVKLTLACPVELVRLYQQNFPFVNIVDWKGEDLGTGYDFHSPMLSLLKWLGIKGPNQIDSTPYLISSLPSIRLPSSKLKIGLCWSSGDHGPKLLERRRNVPLNLLLPLLEIPNCRVISLQKGENERDISAFGAESLLFDPMPRCEDFADTAAVVSELNLVITVDSAVAHLAGALGKPVWMLGPYTRCWRWWHQTSGKPWYQNFKIFQQSSDGSWDFACKTVVKKAWELEKSYG